MLNYNYTDNQMSGPAITPNQSPPPPGAGQGGEEGGGEEDFPASPKKDLFIFHLPNGMTGGQLYDLFSQFGKLRRARIQFHTEEGKRETKGYGFVTFKRFSDAVVAVHSLNGFSVGGKVLAVTYCRDTPRPISANNSVSTNNGTNSAGNRKAHRGQRQRRASASASA
eukprot:scaffold9523_cov74-Skeletonema_dohrnii-CCMP3373.AAC.2